MAMVINVFPPGFCNQLGARLFTRRSDKPFVSEKKRWEIEKGWRLWEKTSTIRTSS